LATLRRFPGHLRKTKSLTVSYAVPIFPLGDMVLFPDVTTEFYIFEPRYIELIENCLDSRGEFCFATLTGNWQELYHENPELHPYGCLCIIEEYKKHENGQYSILIRAKSRIMIDEIPSKKSYRQARFTEIDYIDDISHNSEEFEIVHRQITNFFMKQLPNKSIDEIELLILSLGLRKFFTNFCFQTKISSDQKLRILSETSLKKIFIEIQDLL
jgi:Lon protease-like protein